MTRPPKGGTSLWPVRDGPLVTRRNLPHWQIGGHTYFITFRTLNVLLSRDARRCVLEACRHHDDKWFTLWAGVVMPDHVHLLLRPEEQRPGEWWSLGRILHSIKGFSSHRINEVTGHDGPVWLDERFDRIVRDEDEFLEKWNYIRLNPVKKGLCGAPEAWDALYQRTGQRPVPP